MTKRNKRILNIAEDRKCEDKRDRDKGEEEFEIEKVYIICERKSQNELNISKNIFNPLKEEYLLICYTQS